MLLKVFKSNLTWRTSQQQDDAIASLYPDFCSAPCYNGPEEIPAMLRPTSRKEPVTIYAASLGVFAKYERDFIEFLKLCQKRDASIVTLDGCWGPKRKISEAIAAWKTARKNGAAKIGGSISANKKQEASKAAIELIREDWPKPSSQFPTKALLERAGVSLNTAKKHLGRRPIEQANYQVKLKRKARREAKA